MSESRITFPVLEKLIEKALAMEPVTEQCPSGLVLHVKRACCHIERVIFATDEAAMRASKDLVKHKCLKCRFKEGVKSDE